MNYKVHNEIQVFAEKKMQGQNFDSLSFGAFDLKNKSIKTWQVGRYRWFDLASVTKPLTVGLALLAYPELLTEDLILLSEHRAGLPSGGLLSAHGWKEQLLSYKIRPAETLYSDFSPLRAQLEIEQNLKQPLYNLVSKFWDKELLPWTDFKNKSLAAPTGHRNKKIIQGEVHDPKAFVIKEKLAMAGLFATAEGVCKTILNVFEQGLLESVSIGLNNRKVERFIYAWDTVTDLTTTLAGQGCSNKTIGHLGFTGTSVWIDLEKGKGQVILTNATQNYWYDKSGLNQLRKELGSLLWTV